ncbi:MAG TPA: 1-deoxy-D-xylulose-5-phosphate reductoisomerase [Acidimicrobiales bacterium]|nr:1-deoxy-D-xylulose-5-phosphate reductoisomerase [Acidimicrobiales bacterium]
MVDVALLGSTGSIGTQTLDVVDHNPDLFRVVALGAHRSTAALIEQAHRYRPKVVAVGDHDAAITVAKAVPPGVAVLAGDSGLAEAAIAGDVVLNAVVGFAGLPVTLAALEAGKRLALANKESLIAAGPVVRKARRTPGSELIPVDSEHGAIHQCLRAGHPTEVARLVLTASGGPFRGRAAVDLAEVTVEDALAHPTWQMGPKITVDSSTLMNKGLEVIEAHELFGIGYDQIDVVVHPQSIVHSMVSFRDGSTIAQLSDPDMRLPIGYAMGAPDRLPTPFGALDWAASRQLSFEPPDLDAFPALRLAYEAGRRGGVVPTWLSAANEIAVDAFLHGRIPWVSICAVIEEALASAPNLIPSTVSDVLEADANARSLATQVVNRWETR